MGKDEPSPITAEALLEHARMGGSGAALAARRAAILAERSDPALALEALSLAARLEPLDPAPRLALARVAAEQGDLKAAAVEATAVLQESIDRAAQARAAFMLGEMARVQGEAGAARGYYETTLRIEDALLAGDLRDPTAARWYARARGRIAELDADAGALGPARTGAEGALAMLRAAAAQTGETPVLAADIADAEMRLGVLELDEGSASSARRRLAEAIGRYEALAVTEPDEPHWRAVLSDAWALAAEADYVRGAAEPARTAMDKALQARVRLAAWHPEEAWALAGTWRVRAALRAALGDAEVAAESLQQARALAETLCLRAAGAEGPARFLVHTLLDQADHALRTGDVNRAREAADTARVAAEGFAQETDAAAWFGETAACWDRLGEAARGAKANDKAHDAFTRAVEFRRMGYDRAPNDQQHARGVSAALIKLGESALETGALASARTAFRESVALRIQSVEASPDDMRALRALAVSLERLGLAAQAAGDLGAARDAWEEELSLADRFFEDDTQIEALRFRATVEAHLAGAGGAHAETHRVAALEKFDALAKAGVMTEREAALRRKLWGG